MRISLLCSDANHPVDTHLKQWMQTHCVEHEVELVRTKRELSGGDILFLISCSEIIDAQTRQKYRASLVLHASDLPKGRGWSPHIWQILNGQEELTLSLLEAEDKVDSGRIWAKERFSVPQHALSDEINEALFAAELKLMSYALKHFESVRPEEQDAKVQASYYPKRAPKDSELDPDRSIAAQFNQIRVCDPERFPAFFKLHGKTYKLFLEKVDE